MGGEEIGGFEVGGGGGWGGGGGGGGGAEQPYLKLLFSKFLTRYHVFQL